MKKLLSAATALLIATTMAGAHEDLGPQIHPHGGDWAIWLALLAALGATYLIARRR